MSTETQTQTTTSAIVPPSAAPVLPDPNKEPDNDPPWLAKRLERAEKSGEKKAADAAKKAILAELGIEDSDAVKKLLADEKKRADEKKSLEQRLAERDSAEAKRQAELSEYREATKVLAGEQLAALSEEQKTAVLALAGDDPAKQIKTIAALRPTWKSAAPSAVIDDGKRGAAPSATSQQQTAPPPTTPFPKPADTAPPAGAPPPAGSTVTSNHLATYEHLRKVAPISAALYFAKFGPVIVEARKARGG